MTMRMRIPASFILALAMALPAYAILPGISSSSVSGNTVSLSIALPGSLGADVTLTFEDVTGLSLTNLGVSVHVINPLDPALLARLPGGSVPAAAFPVLLRIEPPSTGGLSFSGVASLRIHTHNLQYTATTPLRIFSAPLGGAFKDVTASMGSGSYRARSTTGGFSEFLIVSEGRTVDQVIVEKFDRLEALLEGYEGTMSSALYDDLEELLEAARAEYVQGDTLDAIQEVDEFIELVEDNSGGTGIPNVWRSARDLTNAAGYLRAGAMTLDFSLALKHSSGQ